MKPTPMCSEKPEPNSMTGAGLRCGVTNFVSLQHRPDLCPIQLYTIEEIHDRAQTLTPLLEEILNLCPPFDCHTPNVKCEDQKTTPFSTAFMAMPKATRGSTFSAASCTRAGCVPPE